MNIINMDLSLVNRHWKTAFKYNFPLKRDLFSELVDNIHSKFIITIIGLRRTGKTTLMRQLINYLIYEEEVAAKQILYYTFDEKKSLDDVIENYQVVTGKSIEDNDLFLFLDEIQKLDDWQNKVKIYFDHYPNIKFIVSGSSSLFIQKTNESLAGRTTELKLNPLSFKEFLHFKGKDELFENPEMWMNQLIVELELYMKRQFIEIIDTDESTRSIYTDTLIRKIIFEDIPLIYSIDYPHILFDLYSIITNNPGMLLNHNTLASDLEINSKTVRKYVHFLEHAYLIKKLYNFSKNRRTSEKKLKKVYPISSSFSLADTSNTIENLVATQLESQFFWRKYYEVDIVMTDNDLVPIEVKYKDKIRKEDIAGLRSFMKQFNVSKGIVITKNLEKCGGEIHFIPAWKFLLENT